MRYGILVNLFVSVLAGIGLASLARRSGRLAGTVAVVAMALVLIDLGPKPLPLSEVEARPVDRWLAAQPGNGAVAQFPFNQMMAPQHTYYTLTHQKPFIGGFFAAYAPPQFSEAAPVLATFPSDQSVAVVKRLRVEWVLVDSTQYKDIASVDQQVQALGLHKVGQIGTEYVYQVLEDE